ncbi:MAG: undecaprenyl-phosphate glucose phosphotransferase [Alphaproteobacteria bacterium]|nr:undecaprenyl-phosphate glucose phosphotransferase [Alphaproteobacteria bacterium]
MLLASSDRIDSRASPSVWTKYSALLDVVLRLGDLGIGALAALLAYWARFGIGMPTGRYRDALVLTPLLTLLVFPAFGLYRSWRSDRVAHEVARLAVAWAAVVLACVALAYLLKIGEQVSRLWVAAWLGAGWGLFALHRRVTRGILGALRARGLDQRRVLIVGATASARAIADTFKAQPWMGFTAVGVVATAWDDTRLDALTPLGAVNELADLVRRHDAQQVWIALPLRAEALIRDVLARLDQCTTEVKLVPDMVDYRLLRSSAENVGGLMALNLSSTPLKGHARLFKSLFDRTLAAMVLVLLAPLLALIALAVKLSSRGPVLYRQQRHGLGGRAIEVLKFRTMRLHDEPAGQVIQAMPHDPRVTALGRVLRRTSLDELPQFWNVLKGEMSVVGPRPHAAEHNHDYGRRLQGYMQRHRVKPGLTGLAQINGFRGPTETLDKMAQRVELDIDYIERWSLWLDLKIILMTLPAMLRRTNAY